MAVESTGFPARETYTPHADRHSYTRTHRLNESKRGREKGWAGEREKWGETLHPSIKFIPIVPV